MVEGRILVFEGSFPNRYGNWHTRELISLLNTGNADIHVNRFDSFAGVEFEVDVEVLRRYIPSSLRLYFLILDSKFNFLQRENPPGFDGTSWNGLLPGSYVVSTRPSFSLTDYDRVYAIFLTQLDRIKQQFADSLGHTKKFVHLYGGGGFHPRSKLEIHPEVTAICNHPASSAAIRSLGGAAIDVWGGPTMFPEEALFRRPARRREQKMGVVFSIIGIPSEKGLAQFCRISRLYRVLFPFDSVRFHVVGNPGKAAKLPPNVTLHGPMPFWQLEHFYREEAHVLLSLTTKRAFNGWPMGIEAMKHGVAVLSTDPHRQRDLIPDRAGATFHRFSIGFVLHIRSMYRDPREWERQSLRGQAFVGTYCSYEAQQQRILEILGQVPVVQS